MPPIFFKTTQTKTLTLKDNNARRKIKSFFETDITFKRRGNLKKKKQKGFVFISSKFLFFLFFKDTNF
jgi:hypothetical protein